MAYSVSGGAATIERAFGTSFILDGTGTRNGGSLSMTAAHVLQNAIQFCKETKLLVGTVGKANDGKKIGSVVAPILSVESAPSSSDIAIFLSRYRSETHLCLGQNVPDVWQDVATLGYPDEAIGGDADSLRLNLRVQKGHIQRRLEPGDLLHRPELRGFELSFLLAGGMSGSPIFVHGPDNDAVVGVSVGTFGSETMISEITKVQDNGATYHEVQNSLNRYGVAESVDGLANWSPKVLMGVTLGEFLAGERADVEQLFVAGTQLDASNLGG